MVRWAPSPRAWHTPVWKRGTRHSPGFPCPHLWFLVRTKLLSMLFFCASCRGCPSAWPQPHVLLLSLRLGQKPPCRGSSSGGAVGLPGFPQENLFFSLIFYWL